MPTATCVLFVLVILAHERRRVVHIAVTERPTAAWTAQQLREAFPWDEAPRYLIRDRDSAFHAWTTTAAAMSSEDVLTAVRSPWPHASAARLIGSLRPEFLHHILVGNARRLRPVFAVMSYHHGRISRSTRMRRFLADHFHGDGRVVAIRSRRPSYRYERRAG